MTPESSRPEFSRMIDPRNLADAPPRIGATREECAALAKRFALVSIEQLEAQVTFAHQDKAILATGRLRVEIVQTCAISGEPLAAVIDEPLVLRFVPARAAATAEEVELTEAELDEIEYAGSAFDLGEAVAQSLALAIDPYATGPEAERVRKAVGLSDEASGGAFAALAALRKP